MDAANLVSLLFAETELQRFCGSSGQLMRCNTSSLSCKMNFDCWFQHCLACAADQRCLIQWHLIRQDVHTIHAAILHLKQTHHKNHSRLMQNLRAPHLTQENPRKITSCLSVCKAFELYSPSCHAFVSL